jgi:hypothetical protein
MPLTPQYMDPTRSGTTTGPRENLTGGEMGQLQNNVFLGGVGGTVASKKVKKKDKKGGNSGGGQSAAPATPAPQPKKKKKKKPQEPQKQQPVAYNPFTERFKTPGELRAEAARLAALSVPSEESLREQQAREEAGLAGLAGQLTGRVQQYVGQTGAGLAGLGALYGNIVGQARTAGEQAAAAAGAAPGVVTPAQPSESVAAQMANIGGAMAGFVPAAAMTGAQLVGASKQSLSKALADRASRISENTAKYLQQLQQSEVERAIAQQTAAQNAARLGLAEREFGLEQQESAFGQQVDLARLNLSQQRLALDIAETNQGFGKDKRKKIASAKTKILENADDWTTGDTGKFSFKFQFLDANGRPASVDAVGANEQEALGQVSGLLPSNVLANQSYTIQRGSREQGDLGPQAVLAKVVPILVNSGMTRKNARAWVIKNLLGGNANVSGAFAGGVGGTR